MVPALLFVFFTIYVMISIVVGPALVDLLDARLTGDQEVAGSTPAEVDNFLS